VVHHIPSSAYAGAALMMAIPAANTASVVFSK